MRVLPIIHADLIPPDDISDLSDKEILTWKTEYDVLTALEHLGHEVKPLGLYDDPAPLRDELLEWKPNIVFNLLEEFHGLGSYVPFVLGYLELMRQPYTGCNPSGLLVAADKRLMKKILKHHHINTPDFAVFPIGKRVQRPKKLGFPLIVKSAVEHGSVGIAQASVVNTDQELEQRVAFVHGQIRTAALAEEYIEGRELYVGIIGNKRLHTLPIWELTFKNLPEGVPRIATTKVKWDPKYQEKVGVDTGPAANLSASLRQQILTMCKRCYRILGLSGYARMDLRLTEDGRIFLLEPNPNPDLSLDEDFAESARADGVVYEPLIEKLLTLGLRYHAEWKKIAAT